MAGFIELSAQEKRAWLRLIRTEHIGPATFRQLLRRYGDAAGACEALPHLSSARRNFQVASEDQISAELEQAEAIGASYLASCEAGYPTALRSISDAPPILCVCGNQSLLEKQSVAIVGARNASAAGRKIAGDLAKNLGESGLIITSGLARGIDGAAHLAALQTGTIAVVAGGLDVIYPPEHGDLTRDIARLGLIISELPPGYQPKGRDFPRRNRIISGLSLGVIVVEAAIKSGTLITARFALEQGREVFAIPGSPLDPRCHGTNRLIRDGATLIENADDVLDALRGMTNVIREPEDLFTFDRDIPEGDIADPQEVSQTRQKLLELLSFTPIHRDILLRECDALPAIVADALLDLVLNGEAEEHSGGKFSLAVE